jgi:hypothetical protein
MDCTVAESSSVVCSLAVGLTHCCWLVWNILGQVASSKCNRIHVASGTAYILPVELHIFFQWNCIHSASGIAYILPVELHTFCQWNCIHLCQFSLCCNCRAWGWKWSPSFCSLDCGLYVASSSSRNARFMSCHVHWCWYSQAVSAMQVCGEWHDCLF